VDIRNGLKNGYFDVSMATLNNVLGLVNMVENVDVIGTSITGGKQITTILRHNGQGNSPDITIDVGAVKFQFQGSTNLGM
jgi:hypothetical protein